MLKNRTVVIVGRCRSLSIVFDRRRSSSSAELEPFGAIAYVDYGDSSEHGHVRYQDAAAAAATVEAFADGKRELLSKVPTVTLVRPTTTHDDARQ